jgi:hypothetical protein
MAGSYALPWQQMGQFLNQTVGQIPGSVQEAVGPNAMPPPVMPVVEQAIQHMTTPGDFLNATKLAQAEMISPNARAQAFARDLPINTVANAYSDMSRIMSSAYGDVGRSIAGAGASVAGGMKERRKEQVALKKQQEAEAKAEKVRTNKLKANESLYRRNLIDAETYAANAITLGGEVPANIPTPTTTAFSGGEATVDLISPDDNKLHSYRINDKGQKFDLGLSAKGTGQVGPDGQPTLKLSATEQKQRREDEELVNKLSTSSAQLKGMAGVADQAYWSSDMPLTRAKALLLASKYSPDLAKKVAGWFGDPNLVGANATMTWDQIMGLESAKMMAEQLKGSTAYQEMIYYANRVADPATPPDQKKVILNYLTTLMDYEVNFRSKRATSVGSQNLPELSPEERETFDTGKPKPPPNMLEAFTGNQGATQAPSAPGAPPSPGGGQIQAGGVPSTPTISSDQEYDALPSGTEFVGPDGQKRRKP